MSSLAQAWFVLLLTSIAFGWLSSQYAKKTGRDPIRWAIAGGLLNILIVAVMLFMGDRSQGRKRFI